MIQKRYQIAQATLMSLSITSKVPLMPFISFRITLPIYFNTHPASLEMFVIIQLHVIGLSNH